MNINTNLLSCMDYCMKFYKEFSQIEVEIISCLAKADYNNVIGGYTNLCEKLGRNQSDISNTRKAALKLWKKGYINLINNKGYINRSVDKPKKVIGFSLVENFLQRLNAAEV